MTRRKAKEDMSKNDGCIKSIMIGIIVTVVGGLILFLVTGSGRQGFDINIVNEIQTFINDNDNVSTTSTSPTSNINITSVRCRLDLRYEIQSQVQCSEGHLLVETTDNYDPWNGLLSRLTVPEGWGVIVFYETWIPPNYSEKNLEKEGFVRFSSGEHLLTNSYDVYSDSDLSLLHHRSKPSELNDRVQYIDLVPSEDGILELSENIDQSPSFGRQLLITYNT